MPEEGVLRPGDRVIMVMPNWQRLGTVLLVRGRSIRIIFDDEREDGPRLGRVFPDGMLYVERWQAGERTEIIKVLDPGYSIKLPELRPDQPPLPPEELTVQAACALFGIEQKQLRTWLRAGKVQGFYPTPNTGNQWMVSVDSLGRYLADRR